MSEKHERTEATNTRILTMLAKELDLKPTRVRAAVNLLDSGASVPTCVLLAPGSMPCARSKLAARIFSARSPNAAKTG